MRSRIVGLLIASVLGTLPLAASATPAQADETWLQHGASFAKVGAGHTKITWCDGPYDSMATRVKYYTNKWHTTREAWFSCDQWQTDHPITRYCLEVITVAVVCRQP